MKILMIRMSSIGDIVLTTPAIRCVKQQVEGCELHFVVKRSFVKVVEENPYIDRLYVFDDNLQELITTFKAEKFDLILDLHNNLRSFLIKKALWRVPSSSFFKENISKWKMVNWKRPSEPIEHCVERYLAACSAVLPIKNDGKGMDYFLAKEDNIAIETLFPALKNQSFIAYGFGGTYSTKRMPNHQIRAICERMPLPVVLLGGPGDADNADAIANDLDGKVFHACRKLRLNQSVAVLQQAAVVVAHDTGLMHIAAALQMPLVSVWGCTVPEMGMTPYQPNEQFTIVENNAAGCRPCSKLGFADCPKKHFDCMNNIPPDSVLADVQLLLERFDFRAKK